MVTVGSANAPLLNEVFLKEKALELGLGKEFIEETSLQELQHMVMKVWAKQSEEEK